MKSNLQNDTKPVQRTSGGRSDGGDGTSLTTEIPKAAPPFANEETKFPRAAGDAMRERARANRSEEDGGISVKCYMKRTSSFEKGFAIGITHLAGTCLFWGRLSPLLHEHLV